MSSPTGGEPSSTLDPPPPPSSEAVDFKKSVQGVGVGGGGDSSSDDEGPAPLPSQLVGSTPGGFGGLHNDYGGNLLPGEGEALSAYVQQNVRIPRRGEIGFDEKDIDKYEASGYVMSGSRHARMNAVRLRKENQIYTQEEKRALALITFEEKQVKEGKLMEDFKELLERQKRTKEIAAKAAKDV